MTARVTTMLALLALAEAAIISPFVWILVPPPAGWTQTALVGVIWLVIFVLTMQWRWLANRGVRLQVQRVLMGGWLIAMFVVLEVQTFGGSRELPDLLLMAPGFLIALVLWWRGMALGSSDLQPRTVDTHFQVGVLLLCVASLVSMVSKQNEPFGSIIAFFFASLAVVPLSNLEYTNQHRYGRRMVMTRRWWLWVMGISVGVILLGTVVVGIVTGKGIPELVAGFISIVLLPLVLLLSLLPATFFDWLISAIRRLLENLSQLQNLRPAELPQETKPPDPGTLVSIPPEANFIIAIVVFLALAIVLILLMQQARKQASPPQPTARDLEGNLKNAADSSDGRSAPRRGLDALRRWLAVMTIRRIYARAIYEANRRGQKRLPSQTPYDFLPNMQRAFPDAEQESRAITDAYVAAHYGQVPDSQDALDALKAAWERMRATQRQLAR